MQFSAGDVVKFNRGIAVSIPQAVGTIAICVDIRILGLCNSVSIPQAVGTIAIIKALGPGEEYEVKFQYRKR